MLPMLSMPREVPLEDPVLEPRPPTAENREVWMSAARAAAGFWSSVTDGKRVTPKFRRIAEGCGARLERLIRKMKPMLGDA